MKKLPILFCLFLFTIHSSFAQKKGTVYGKDLLEFEVEVVDRETEHLVSNANVYLYEMPGGKLIQQAYTTNGTARFTIDPMKSYEVRTCHSKYLNGGMSIYENYSSRNRYAFCVSGASFYDLHSDDPDFKVAKLYAKLPIDEIVVGKTFRLDNIYFDLDKSYLRSSSRRELDKLVDIMQQFPSLEVEMGSHTDSRASHEYNASLSQRRAQSTYEYLVQKGISPNRLTYKGYGETQLVNECADGVKCSERKHQLNRRTEFKITRFDGKDCGEPPVVKKAFSCCN